MTRPRFWCLQSMSVVDTRLLGRRSTFGGAEAEWPDWAFSVRAYGAAIDAAFLVAMEAASRAVAPVLVTTLGVPEQNVARQLFFMLAMMTKGPALAIVRQAEISGGGPNGLEAWRLLVRRYEPEAATRTPGLLQQILNPVPFPDNVTGFEEALSKWELTISRWESSAHDASNEGVKIALLLKMTPGTATTKPASPRPHKVWSGSCCCRECSLVSTLLAECPRADGSWRDWWQEASQG